ncbi:MAG: class I SAM-dependent methyltransferase [Oceanospirillaceae bacterium]|mgnify:CR=1 FL=1|jgi:ubiquinone/menaquinone biosynthesis C-methylase UbiE|nr:class I SAM-dependent methyltransferase [Oceanospirillaceae bacterium]MBT4442761.1 class I SAM-dependent methyltransferase [Oceanospirillaceae bacterium]MBT6078670.1 class I SAM-dependent methyltransferase [Oceanospirillaceae bacterium]
MKNREDYTEANRTMWNETAAVHQTTYVDDLLKRIKAPDYCTFDTVEQRLFEQIGLSGKAVVQPSCNNSRELIAVKKAGAARCLGLDISDAFITQGKQLAQAAEVDIELVRANLYDIKHEYDNQFDLAYVTVGALGWLPDLPSYMTLLSRMLKPHGKLFIYEMHPAMIMFETESGSTVVNDYFQRTAYREENDADYMNPDAKIESPSYWFQHTLGDILGQCIDHGLNINHFEEYRHDISNVGAHLEQSEHCPPLCFSLIAQKN